MDREWIERYAAGAGVVGEAIRGLNREDLLAHPVAGTWSMQQIVLHLMDSDLIGSDRMKRVIAEERPRLMGYDETAFAARLGYEQMDAAKAAEVFRLNREMTAGMLRRLDDAAFVRVGEHSERGEESLAELVQGYAEHLDHHMKFVRRKREMLGKAM